MTAKPLVRRIAGTAGLIVGLAIGVFVADREGPQIDLTATGSLTLSDETLRVLSQVDRKASITVVLPPGEPGRAEAASLLSRYRRANHRITFRIVDGASSPGLVRSLGIDDVFGGIAVQIGDRVERGPAASERDLTSALVRAVRDEKPMACFTTGHGELSILDTTGDGLAAAAEALVANGYRVEEVDLLVGAAIPPECGALVMVNPTSPLGGAENAVAEWVDAGGALLAFTDPISTVDLSPLTRPYGLSFDRGIVFERDDSARLAGDPTTPVVTSFRSAIPVVRRLPPIFFAAASAVVVDQSAEDRVPGLVVAALAVSSDSAFLEKSDPNEATFDAEVDRAGPITFMAAANRTSVEERSRVVVVSDVDLVTNNLLGQAGHTRLLLQALDWLTLDRGLVSVSPNLPDLRPLALSERRATYMRLVTAGAVPALFLLAGAMVWAVRRGR